MLCLIASLTIVDHLNPQPLHPPWSWALISDGWCSWQPASTLRLPRNCQSSTIHQHKERNSALQSPAIQALSGRRRGGKPSVFHTVTVRFLQVSRPLLSLGDQSLSLEVLGHLVYPPNPFRVTGFLVLLDFCLASALQIFFLFPHWKKKI